MAPAGAFNVTPDAAPRGGVHCICCRRATIVAAVFVFVIVYDPSSSVVNQLHLYLVHRRHQRLRKRCSLQWTFDTAPDNVVV